MNDKSLADYISNLEEIRVRSQNTKTFFIKRVVKKVTKKNDIKVETSVKEVISDDIKMMHDDIVKNDIEDLEIGNNENQDSETIENINETVLINKGININNYSKEINMLYVLFIINLIVQGVGLFANYTLTKTLVLMLFIVFFLIFMVYFRIKK